MRLRVLLLSSALLLTAAAAGCGGPDSEDATPGPATPSQAAPSTPTSAPYSSLDGPLGSCGPQPADVSEAGFRYRVLRDAQVGRLPVVTAGRGSTVAVLLHQTDGNGLCGWLPYAAEITAGGSARVLAVDLCGYGRARCRDGADPVDAARVAIDVARRDLGAKRIVLVGASMGGSIALMASVGDQRVDAVADLSGPTDWPGMQAVRGGRALGVPALVAMADTESETDVRRARAIVENAPAGSRFVGASDGHGYDLLLDENGEPGPLAAPLLAWIG